MTKCKKCGLENAPGVRFCQGCGGELRLRGGFAALNFSSLAGTGLRGTSVAPLFTSDLLKATPTAARKPRAIVRPLEDASWYCPDCGKHNAPHQTFCLGCGREG